MADQSDEDLFNSLLKGSEANQAVQTAQDEQDQKEFAALRAQTAVQQRAAGRQWLLPEAIRSTNPKASPFFGGNVLPAIEALGAPTQALEDAVARNVDTVTGGSAAKSLPKGVPMEIGDIFAAHGAPEWASSLLGLLFSGFIPGIHQLAGAAGGNAVGAAGNAIRSSVLQNFFPGAGAALMRKSPAAVKYMINNPDDVFTPGNMQNAEHTAQQLGNEMSRRILDVKKSSQDLYKQAAQSVTDTPIDSKLGQQSGALMRSYLTTETDPDSILNATAWKEAPSANSYTMTHSYLLPQESGLVDEYGNKLMTPGQLSSKGTVVERSGPNSTAETQLFGYTPEGKQYVKGVQTVNKTTDSNTLAPVSIGDALDRLQTGQPVSMKQLVNLRNKLQDLRANSGTAGRMSDEALDLLGQHDPSFNQAASAWRDYKTLEGDRGARSLFGGINEDYNKNIPADEQVVANNSGNLLGYFNQPETSKTAAAPALVDKILGQYGPQTNYEARIKALSAGEGMHEWQPHGHFAVGAFVGGAGAHMASEIPGLSTIVTHPAVEAVGAAAGLGLIAGSSRTLSRNVIRAMTTQGVLPRGFSKAYNSPAGRWLRSSYNPAALAAIGGAKSLENGQPQHDDSYETSTQ